MKDAVTEIGTRLHGGPARRDAALQLGLLRRAAEADRGGRPRRRLHLGRASVQMDELEKRKLIVSGTRRVFARNLRHRDQAGRLPGGHLKAGDLADARVTRIVVATPGRSPRASTRRRASGRAGSGIACSPSSSSRRTCARRSTTWRGARWTRASSTPPTRRYAASAVKEAFRPADDTYRPVVYPAAVVAETRQPALAQAFVDQLRGSRRPGGARPLRLPAAARRRAIGACPSRSPGPAPAVGASGHGILPGRRVDPS